MIIRRCDLVSNLRPAEDFRVDVIYVTPEFIEISTPPCNFDGTFFGIVGSGRLPTKPRHFLLRQQTLRYLKIHFWRVQKSERFCRQLLDFTLHHARHQPSTPHPKALYNRTFRTLLVFVAIVFHPLCPKIPWGVAVGTQGMIFFREKCNLSRKKWNHNPDNPPYICIIENNIKTSRLCRP